MTGSIEEKVKELEELNDDIAKEISALEDIVSNGDNSLPGAGDEIKVCCNNIKESMKGMKKIIS